MPTKNSRESSIVAPRPAQARSPRRRLLIVGGVAGGASAAARARRLCEDCQIIVFERGPHVSFASCGLAYHVGGVIEDEQDLLVATPQLFAERLAVDVRTGHEVLSIDRKRKRLRVRELATGNTMEEPYDALLLSPGARPVLPAIAGIGLPGVHSLRNIEDVRRVRETVDRALHSTKRAVVVGGGFIGLELAENLLHRGLNVTLVERGPQVLPSLDPEMGALLSDKLREHGTAVRLNTSVESIEPRAHGLSVSLDSDERVEADLVLFAVGVRPENSLAQDAGLELGPRGGILVDRSLRTSDPAIWAVGDAIEVHCAVTGQELLVPLAGPASRQGRLAADNMVRGTEEAFGDVEGTSVLGLFELTAARTGALESQLEATGRSYEVLYTHPAHHAGYYPGARGMVLKLLVDAKDGRVLGAQAVGERGVERRIDVIAMAMQFGARAQDLARAELCYAPQYGSAKDPVNQIGMLAENVLSGDVPSLPWRDLDAFVADVAEPGASGTPGLVLDIRSPEEVDEDPYPTAVHVPLTELRARAAELSGARVAVLCASGQRANIAVRLLRARGVDARLLSGGIKTWHLLQRARRDAGASLPDSNPAPAVVRAVG